MNHPQYGYSHEYIAASQRQNVQQNMEMLNTLSGLANSNGWVYGIQDSRPQDFTAQLRGPMSDGVLQALRLRNEQRVKEMK